MKIPCAQDLLASSGSTQTCLPKPCGTTEKTRKLGSWIAIKDMDEGEVQTELDRDEAHNPGESLYPPISGHAVNIQVRNSSERTYQRREHQPIIPP